MVEEFCKVRTVARLNSLEAFWMEITRELNNTGSLCMNHATNHPGTCVSGTKKTCRRMPMLSTVIEMGLSLLLLMATLSTDTLFFVIIIL